jgi:hypothetical protein
MVYVDTSVLVTLYIKEANSRKVWARIFGGDLISRPILMGNDRRGMDERVTGENGWLRYRTADLLYRRKSRETFA